MPTSKQIQVTDIHRGFARLTVAFGDSRVSDPASRALLAREWSSALGHLEPEVLERSIARVILQQKFWPTISEILEAAKIYDTRTTEEKFGARHSPPPTNDKFCRAGRTQVEELAYRVASLKRIKSEEAAARPIEVDAEEEKRQPIPASQAMWLSPQLQAHARKHGYWKGAE